MAASRSSICALLLVCVADAANRVSHAIRAPFIKDLTSKVRRIVAERQVSMPRANASTPASRGDRR
jgi:hypothetical protein